MALNGQPSKTKVWFGYLAALLVVVAILVPWIALRWNSETVIRSWATAVTPFATSSIAMVHVLATLPLAWLAGAAALSVLPRATGSPRATSTVCVVAGSALALASIRLGATLGASWYGMEPEIKALVRVVWAFLLVAPWAAASWVLIQDSLSLPRASASSWVLALLAAAALPLVYANQFIDQETARAETMLASGRVWKSWQIVEQLVSLGSREPVLGRSPRNQLDVLSVQLQQHEEVVQVPLPDDAAEPQRIERAQHFIALERMSEAEQTLLPLARRRPDASLMLGAVYVVRGNLNASVDATRHALQLLEDQGEQDPSINRLREQAFSRLADSLRRGEKYRDAEQLLQAGLRRWKASSAFLHFQLGYHYHLGGRPQRALRHFQEAARRDKELALQAASAINNLKLSTPVCLLRPILPATR